VGVGSNTATVYWMDVNNYYVETKRIKYSQMGHTK